MRHLREDEIQLLAALQDFEKEPTDEKRQAIWQAIERAERLDTGPGFIAQAQKEYGVEQAYHVPSFQPNRRLSVFAVVSQVALLAAVLVLVILVLNLQGEVGPSTEPKGDDVQATEIEVTPSPFTPICGGSGRIPVPEGPPGTFRRDLGLTVYNTQNTNGGIANNHIRGVTIDERGVWFGYYPNSDGSNPINGIGQFDKGSWELCKTDIVPIGQNTNDIAISPDGTVWVATDGFGVAVLDTEGWHTFTDTQGLPDNRTYSVVVDQQGATWLGAWQGVAQFDGSVWRVPYSVSDGDTIVDNHITKIAFHPNGEIWIGYLDAGVSRFTNDGQWLYYSATTTPDALASDVIRDIVFDHEGNIWIATEGGGVSTYNPATQIWTLYTTTTSNLSNDNVRALAVDKYGRVWAATQASVMYFDGSTWQEYAYIESLSIAFGPSCTECPYNDEHVWLGTAEEGLTQSRIPQPSNVIEVVSVEYPREVNAGETFSPRVTVRVLPGYQLTESDGLFYTEASDDHLFGAHERIPVIGKVSAGQSYEFYNYETDQAFVAPSELGTYTSIWRVWASGRYVGEPIVIEFTVVE